MPELIHVTAEQDCCTATCGGILRCDTLATGVVAAARDLGIKVPIVVRMEGTNVEMGQKILAESGLNFTVANGMLDAAQKVVRLAQ